MTVWTAAIWPSRSISMWNVNRWARPVGAGNSANEAESERRVRIADGGLRRMHGVVDSCLLFFHLGLGGCAYLDHRDAANQLREPLLQLFTIVPGRRVLDLCANLFHATFDRLSRSSTFDDLAI